MSYSNSHLAFSVEGLRHNTFIEATFVDLTGRTCLPRIEGLLYKLNFHQVQDPRSKSYGYHYEYIV